ncbi:MAG: acetoacetate--CoA ligase, partial [Leptospiraceae bacterium]|nr:acetoacetate--CoA ligase [Leptospiraceae bacterium]
MIENPILWEPGSVNEDNCHLIKFINLINNKYNLTIQDYSQIHRWSIDNIESFWREFIQFCGFKYKGSINKVLTKKSSFQETIWFEDIKTNFAENFIYKIKEELNKNINRTIIISYKENSNPIEIKSTELLEKVGKLSNAMRELGIKKGDRIVTCLPNIPEVIYIMLATTSLGAIFSSSSPDFGQNAILDRFGQISPSLYFCSDEYSYKGKLISKLEEHSEISNNIKSLKKTIVISDTKNSFSIPNSISFNDFINNKSNDLKFEEMNFSDPVYIMYSSGTTGLPKCMVQGSGVLLNHKKEQLLHVNLLSREKIFYFTTCGWMMWNWLVSAISLENTIVLFDGNPFYPGPERLWEIAEKEQIEVFGTSAGYLSALQKTGVNIKNNFSLNNLKSILSTGSPLLSEQFDFVYNSIKTNVQLSSISGGTDLNGCFVLSSPILSVRRGEIQAPGLGMDVDIFSNEGVSIKEIEGELVCKKPFPSMPVYFWNDKDGNKYKKAYFSKFPEIWRHGDYAISKNSGGFIIQGRSDATLNPGGVRIGTADIYRIV